MSGDVEHPMQCEAIADDLAELALGTLSGRRRSDLLDHVGSCDRAAPSSSSSRPSSKRCSSWRREVQPPLGFELRLVERLHGEATPRPRRHRRIAVLSAGCGPSSGLLVFGLGTLVAPGDGNDTAQSAGSEAARANFTSQGQVVGELFLPSAARLGCS